MSMPRSERTSRTREFFLFLLGIALLASVAFKAVALAAAAPDPLPAAAPDDAAVQAMNRTAEELYAAVVEGEWQRASRLTDAVVRQFSDVRWTERTSIQGVEAFVAVLSELKRGLAAVALDPHSLQVGAAKLRLAADALRKDREPMWKQYGRLLKEDVAVLERELAKGRDLSQSGWKGAWKTLKEHAETVRPAIFVSLDASIPTQLYSLLAAADRETALGAPDPDKMRAYVQQLRPLLDNVFGSGEETAYLPLSEPRAGIYWTALIGAFVLLVLALVGWQKFRFDRGYVSITSRRRRPPR